MPSYDISLPISNNMWRYQPGWENSIHAMSDTNQGDADSVYRFDLCSHTGTYIETAGHKLSNQLCLDDFPISTFVQQPTVVLSMTTDANACLTLQALEFALANCPDMDGALTNLILMTGWGEQHSDSGYLTRAPWFAPELTDYLASMNLHILGVDTPIIDNQQAPYDAVQKLFQANKELLLLAPLRLPKALCSGIYQLDCAPLNIIGVSAAPCRPVLTGQ